MADHPNGTADPVRALRRPPRVFSIVLAGGEGKRLWPLTKDRTKPAVPVGGVYRLIDFVLSNLVNAEFTRIAVLTQYKSHSLDRHISQAWRLSPLLGNYVTPVPAQMRRGPRWFSGSADAIYQNFNLLGDEKPDYVLVFGADHLYRMDPRQMLAQHIASNAGVTVAAVKVPTAESSSFGVIECDGDRITSFQEKPSRTSGLPDDPERCLASMGNYIFTASLLMDALVDDAERKTSGHDIGGDIIPRLVEKGDAAVYDFDRNVVPGSTEQDHGYWRDVGTLDSYYDAHMDLVSVVPMFNLYNLEWPIYSFYGPLPPAKFVFDEEGRRGLAVDSIVSPGVIVAGGTVRRSVLSPGVRVGQRAIVEDSVLLEGVEVGEGAVVRRAIIDKEVVVPPGAAIGQDAQADARRFAISGNGIVVIAKRQVIGSAAD
jgi:glucose-1-phosphate adenylyltransferase